jgi:hypothetical protein
MPTLHVHDETTTGDRTGDIALEFLTERITVRELIRSRVYQEVQDYNLKCAATPFYGLVQPAEIERELNKPRPSRFREIDWKQQFEIACEAFEQNRVLILIDNRQAEQLEDEIVITPSTEVTFLKLVPLVGG